MAEAATADVVPQVDAETGEKQGANLKDTADATGEEEYKPLSWPEVALYTTLVFVSLYVFLIGLALMGDAFKVLGGAGASGLFGAVDNPISGLMVGILATVLVQSSSTSTSIVVAMTAADIISVKNGIPIIMGANIGTSVTNTIVSMGQAGERVMLQRSFSGATVHDMFNMLSVLTLLPIEAIIGAMQGDGGPLYWMTKGIVEGMGDEGGEPLFDSPVKLATKLIAPEILKSNKYVIYALALGAPVVMSPQGGHCGQCVLIDGMNVGSQSMETTQVCIDLNTTDDEDRRLNVHEWDKYVNQVADEASDETYESSFPARSLLNKRQLQDATDCSSFVCIDSSMKKYFKKTDEDALDAMTSCDAFFPDEPCGGDSCYLEGAEFYDEHITNGRLIKGGFLKGAGDVGGGVIGLIISLFLLCLGLTGLCKSLQKIFLGQAKQFIKYATRLNDYVAICIGVGVTIIVQSSSVTTSALTPLCGLGVLPLKKMLPLTLGANIGTTCTALIGSMVSMKPAAVQIALCHLFFNIFGILIWFPVPFMRQWPLVAARTLGLYASYYRFVPGVYILVSFIVVPGIALGVSLAYDASIALGVILTLVVLAAVGVLIFWWNIGIPMGKPGCYLALSQEQREQGQEELYKAQAKVMNKKPEEIKAEEEAPLSWLGF